MSRKHDWLDLVGSFWASVLCAQADAGEIPPADFALAIDKGTASKGPELMKRQYCQYHP